VDSVRAFEGQMLEFMEKKHGDLLKEIKEKNVISEDLEGKLKKALDEFKTMFQPPQA
jgi:F-type H+-transporting ATPase subunit alpha